MLDHDTIAVTLALTGPFLAGVCLAYLTERLAPSWRRPFELLLPACVLAVALAFDLHTEGPAHGLFPYLFISIPDVLAFAMWRSYLSRRRPRATRP